MALGSEAEVGSKSAFAVGSPSTSATSGPIPLYIPVSGLVEDEVEEAFCCFFPPLLGLLNKVFPLWDLPMCLFVVFPLLGRQEQVLLI